MVSRRFLPLFLLIILLALATSPLLAQDALTQTETATGTDGLVVSVSFPAGWQASTDSQGISLASSADALTELKQTGVVTTAGDVGMIVSLPSFLDNLSLPHDAPADQAVAKYLEAAKLPAATVEASTDFSVPAASAVVTTPNGEAIIGALEFPKGTVIIGVIPASALDETVTAILQSVTLQAPGDTPAAPLVITNPDLPQSSHITDATGLTLTISYPASWIANVTDQGIMLASSADTLKELKQTGNVPAGEIGMSISGPSELDRAHIARVLSAEDTLTAYISGNNAKGTVETSTDFSVPAAISHLSISQDATVLALVGALTFPDGTALFAVVPDKAVDAQVISVLNSITLEAPADIPPVTPDTSVSLTTASFDYIDAKGAVTLTLGLPAGWVTQYSDGGGILYVGNSDEALKKASAPNVTFAPGEVALTIALPHAVIGLGVPLNSAPTTAISTFQRQTQAQGHVIIDTTFGVPTAHARLTGGNLPDGGGDVYAMLFFDQGLIFVVAQPSGILDGTTMAVIQSIQLSQTGALQPTAAATQASSTGDVTTTTITQPNGAFDLSYVLPAGWVSKPSNSGTSFNLGSSAAVAQKVANGQEALAAGELGLTIGSPQLLSQMGVTFNATPEDAVSNFIKITNSKGTVEQDTSFSVPVAHATITGDAIPGGGAELYALAFDGGTLLIAVQPQGATSGDVLDLLKSIRFTPSSETSATAAPATTATPATSAKVLHQWATSAEASSQYRNDDWSASQATGEPNTTTCDDNMTAWASATSTQRAILRVTFDKPVIASQINIYQSFNPGAIVEVDLGSAADPDKVLPLPHSADPAGNTGCPGVFSVDVSGVDAPVNSLVIYLDQSLTGNWNEIDAVELVGTPAS